MFQLMILVGPAFGSPLLEIPPAADAQVLTQRTDGRWIFQYQNRRISCQATAFCVDLRDGLYVVPGMQFRRGTEIIEYLTLDNQWNDCVLRKCSAY